MEQFNYIKRLIRRTFRNEVNKYIILKSYNVMSVPRLLYGSESWIMKGGKKETPGKYHKF
jgi:hypothetical protein